nr:glycosyltransferase family 4 protein [Candidatus Njordarchaeum guaymaensis]
MNHEVTLYAYGVRHERFEVDGVQIHLVPKVLQRLTRFGKLLYGGLEGELALDVASASFPGMAREASHDIANSDIVQVEHLWCSLPPLIHARRMEKPAIFDDHNVETILVERYRRRLWKARQKGLWLPWLWYVASIERIACRLADTILVTSETDRILLHKRIGVPTKKIEVVPNGVNTEVYKPSVDDGRRIRRMYGIDEGDPVLLFLGRCDYPPNRLAAEWIVRELAPKVIEKRPDAKFVIVGRNPPANLTSDRRILFTGEVDNVIPYINAADICLAPITVGSGTRIKVLSYMACGKPVLSTPEGIEGIDVKDGESSVVRSLSDFVDATLDMLNDSRKMR